MAASVAESIQAIRTVQALSLEETFAGAFSSTSDKSSLSDVKGKRLSAALERSVDVLVAGHAMDSSTTVGVRSSASSAARRAPEARLSRDW